ncbi:MAG TPA: tetratricopeptide repeat protein [Candidatus Acidoferrales bacterium]|nr:tetratricopeptide repeat protein [Candidatus Acidoferrales bacterium]
MAPPEVAVYEFGPFRLDASQHLLFRNGDLISLPPKAAETLILLVNNRGRLVRKDAIMSAVWPDCFVEESNLTVQISILRKALGENNGTRYIETIPRRGYRFVAEVTVLADGPGRDDKKPKSANEGPGIGLEGKATSGNPGEAAVSIPMPARRIPGIAVLILTGALGVGAVALTASYRLRLSRASDSHARHSIAVIGFKNVSGKPEDAWLSTAISEMLTTELSAGNQLRTVPGENVAQMKINLSLPEADSYGKDTLNKIHRNLNADDVVLGSYVPVGEGEIRLDLRLQDTTSGETIAALSEKGEVSEIDDLAQRAGNDLRAKLDIAGVSTADAEELKTAMPASPEAAREYSEGLAKMRNFDNLGARDAFEKSVTAEPKFALGHSALATAYSRLGYEAKAREEAVAAAGLATGLTPEERLWVEAQEFETKGELSNAVETYRKLYQIAPDNIEYGLRLANAQENEGKGNDALATIETLRKLPLPAGEDARIDLVEAQTAYTLGDFRREEASAARATERAREKGARLLAARALNEDCWALKTLGQARTALEKCEEARRIFSEAGDNDSMAASLSHIGAILREEGDEGGAKEKLEEALAAWSEVGDRQGVAGALGNMAIGLHAQGDLAGAKSMYERAFAIFREIGNEDDASLSLGNLGGVLEDLGDLAGAREHFEQGVKNAQEVSDKGEEATIQAGLADVNYLQGNFVRARGLARQGYETLRAEGDERDEAVALWVMGRVAMAQDDFAEAQNDFESALRIRTDIGLKVEVGETEEEIAEMYLHEGRKSDAEAECRRALEEFQAHHARDDEIQSRALLARILLEKPQSADAPKQAREEVMAGETLARSSQNPSSKNALELSSAMLLSSKRRDVEAERKLDTVVGQAARRGNLSQEYEARLAIGLVEMRAGQSDGGRSQLAALAKDAKLNGFFLIAREATAASKR